MKKGKIDLETGKRGLLEVVETPGHKGVYALLNGELMERHGFSGLRKEINKGNYAVGLRNESGGYAGILEAPKYIEDEFEKYEELLEETIETISKAGIDFSSSALYLDRADEELAEHIKQFLDEEVCEGENSTEIFVYGGRKAATVRPGCFGMDRKEFTDSSDSRVPSGNELYVRDRTIESIIEFYNGLYEERKDRDRSSELENFLDIVGEEEAVRFRLTAPGRGEYRMRIPVDGSELYFPDSDDGLNMDIRRVGDTSSGSYVEFIGRFDLIEFEEAVPGINSFVSEVYDRCGKKF